MLVKFGGTLRPLKLMVEKSLQKVFFNQKLISYSMKLNLLIGLLAIVCCVLADNWWTDCSSQPIFHYTKLDIEPSPPRIGKYINVSAVGTFGMFHMLFQFSILYLLLNFFHFCLICVGINKKCRRTSYKSVCFAFYPI